jgi:hypothetical protein
MHCSYKDYFRHRWSGSSIDNKLEFSSDKGSKNILNLLHGNRFEVFSSVNS